MLHETVLDGSSRQVSGPKCNILFNWDYLDLFGGLKRPKRKKLKRQKSKKQSDSQTALAALGSPVDFFNSVCPVWIVGLGGAWSSLGRPRLAMAGHARPWLAKNRRTVFGFRDGTRDRKSRELKKGTLSVGPEH